MNEFAGGRPPGLGRTAKETYEGTEQDCGPIRFMVSEEDVPRSGLEDPMKRDRDDLIFSDQEEVLRTCSGLHYKGSGEFQCGR